jgi:hypothetical protein
MKVVAGRGPYFAQIPFHLLDDPEVDAEGIATYCALRRFTDFGSDKGCFASHKTLATVAGLSVRTLKRRLEWLRNNGWVDWDKTVGRSNHYAVNNSRYGVLDAKPHLGQPDLPPQATVAQGVGPADPLPRDSTRETSTKTSTPPAWVQTLGEAWIKIYGGIPSYGQIGKHLKPLVESQPFEVVEGHWGRYLAATEPRFASPARFAQTFGGWGVPVPPLPNQRWRCCNHPDREITSRYDNKPLCPECVEALP